MSNGQSRDINNLNWYVKKKYLELESNCKKKGVKIVVFETTRTKEYQKKLYSYGRTDMSKQIVTNLEVPSFHAEGVGLAFDIYVEVNGKAIWDASHPHWKIVLSEAKKLGFTLGHEWKMRDTCHFQMDEGLKSSQILAGKRPSWFVENKTQSKTSLQILHENKIISNIASWNKWLSSPFIQGEITKALITNFYEKKTGKTDFLEAINYIMSEKIISSKEYWLDNCAKTKFVKSDWVKLIIDRMASKF